MTMPGIGPVTAVSIAVLAAPPEMFSKGRDVAAWIGLAPHQHSRGGKTRLGKISKTGQRGGAPDGSWLARMLARKPKMLVAVALANKMVRMAWAIMAHGGVWETPANA